MVRADVVLGLYLEYARRHPWLTGLSVATLLIIPLQDVLLPHLTGRVVDAVRVDGAKGVLAPLVALILAIAFVQTALAAEDAMDAVMYSTQQNFFRGAMLSCLLDRHDAAHAELRVGDLLSKFAKVPSTMAYWFEAAHSLVPNLLVYVAATAYFAWIDALLGLALAAVVAVMFVSVYASIRMCARASAARDEALNEVQEGIDETLRNLPAVYGGMGKDGERARIDATQGVYARHYLDTTLCSMRLKLWMVPAIVAVVVFALLRCRRLTARGEMSLGTFVSVILVALYMLASLTRLVSSVRGMVFHWGVLQASSHLLEDCAPPQHPPVDVVVPPTGYGCVGVRTGDGAVLRADLHFEPGERLAITGAIGSGKSTLLRVFASLVRPVEGVVYMHGAPYAELALEEARRAIGYVPQSPSLFDRSILENIRYGYGEGSLDEAEIWEAADRLGVGEALREIGLDTLAGKGGSRLSGGQRQLVWILRVLLRKPEVLMLDEPTSALDGASAGLLARLLSTVPTVVLVTHDAALVEAVATRVVRMDDGVLIDLADT